MCLDGKGWSGKVRCEVLGILKISPGRSCLCGFSPRSALVNYSYSFDCSELVLTLSVGCELVPHDKGMSLFNTFVGIGSGYEDNAPIKGFAITYCWAALVLSTRIISIVLFPL